MQFPPPTYPEYKMTKCETCGNQNNDLFEVIKDGISKKFDTFECAIKSMAAPCENCGCLITGLQKISDEKAYCCDVCHQQSLSGAGYLAGTA